MRKNKNIVIVMVAVVVIALCVAAVLYTPNLFEMIKRMHGM